MIMMVDPGTEALKKSLPLRPGCLVVQAWLEVNAAAAGGATQCSVLVVRFTVFYGGG